MDFSSSPRRSDTTTSSASSSSSTNKSRFANFSFLPKSTSKSNKPTSTWMGTAPGIAKRQTTDHWLHRKPSNAEYSRIPKLSPSHESSTNGRNSQLSTGSDDGSSLNEEPQLIMQKTNVKVLFDDVQDMEANKRRAQDEDDVMSMSENILPGYHGGNVEKPLPKSPDSVNIDSSRVAQRLAAVASPPPTIKKRHSPTEKSLINFDDSSSSPDKLLLSDVNGNTSTSLISPFSLPSSVGGEGENGKAPLTYHARVNGNNIHVNNHHHHGPSDGRNSCRSNSRGPRTSLESIRQQIRQIECEMVSSSAATSTHRPFPLFQKMMSPSNGFHQQGESELDVDGGNDELTYCGPSRPLQASYSSQSIPATFQKTWSRGEEVDGPYGFIGRNGSSLGHMQRAHSVDVAVHSVISDIQNAVKRNSMIRLKGSTLSLLDQQRLNGHSQNGKIQEEEDSVVVGSTVDNDGDDVWIKRE